MPESFIPVWMSVGEAENFQRTLHELDDSEAGLPERELSLIEKALEGERRRSWAEMDAEQKAASSSPQAEVQDCELEVEVEQRLGLERGFIPQPFWNDFGDAMMGERAVVAALDKFSFDGRGYSAATANRMREAFAAAFGVALAALAPVSSEPEEDK